MKTKMLTGVVAWYSSILVYCWGQKLKWHGTYFPRTCSPLLPCKQNRQSQLHCKYDWSKLTTTIYFPLAMIHLGMYLSYNSSQDVRGSLLEDFLEVSFFLRRARRRGQLISYIGYWHLLEEEMTTHFSILAGIIPQTEEPGRLQFMGSQRVRHDWNNWEHTLSFLHGTFSCGSTLVNAWG